VIYPRFKDDCPECGEYECVCREPCEFRSEGQCALHPALDGQNCPRCRDLRDWAVYRP
jgi:hypothetical protein